MKRMIDLGWQHSSDWGLDPQLLDDAPRCSFSETHSCLLEQQQPCGWPCWALSHHMKWTMWVHFIHVHQFIDSLNAQGFRVSSQEGQRREDQGSNHSILSMQNQYVHVYPTHMWDYVSVVLEFRCAPMCLGHVISSSGKKSFQGTKELKSTSWLPQTWLCIAIFIRALEQCSS